VLRADQNIEFAQRQFDRYRGFYQGDAVTVSPRFVTHPQPAPATAGFVQTGAAI
jgi:hypothetical protein